MEGDIPMLARDAKKGGKARPKRAPAAEGSSSEAKVARQTGSTLKPQTNKPKITKFQETLRGDLGLVDEFERVIMEDSVSDEIDALAVANKAVVTVPSDSFKYIVNNRLKLGFGHKEIKFYRQWLIQ